jgi:PAP2 superfamily
LQLTRAQRQLAENARTFALINMAISDALVSVFETKYVYTFWRPVTAIRAGNPDGNPGTEPDTGWTPFITTPSFPGYPSAHASGSGAGRKVAELLFGPANHTITLSHPSVPDERCTKRVSVTSRTASTMRASTAAFIFASTRKREACRDAASAGMSSSTISGTRTRTIRSDARGCTHRARVRDARGRRPDLV